MPVKLAEKDLPKPVVKAVIRESKLWKEAIMRLAYRQTFEIKLPKHFLTSKGITDPVTSFKVSLQRYADRKDLKYRIYIVGGVIYATPSTHNL